MAADQVKFTGTLKHLVTEQTQNKFEGAAEIKPSRQRLIITSAVVTISFTFTVAFTFKLIFDVNIFDVNALMSLFQHTGQLTSPMGQTQSQPLAVQAQPQASMPASAQISPLNSKALGLSGYLVIVRICDTPEEALTLKLALRQARVNVDHLIHQSRFVVFIGPVYSKNRADSVLRALVSLGYNTAYLVSPG